MSDEIVKIDKEEKKPFRPGAKPLVGLAARKAALANNPEAKEIGEAHIPELPPGKMPDRIGVVFDDSGSMAGNAITDAHSGVEEFLRSFKPTTTAVAVYPMNDAALKLCTTLPALAQLVRNIRATGGTPAVETLRKMLNSEDLTRAIMFSDGSFSMHAWETKVSNDVEDFFASSRQPNRSLSGASVRAACNAGDISVDTVYIGQHNESAIANLKKIAEDTGGIFLLFFPGKVSFANAFKYLSPGNRLQLMDKSFKEKVENGEI